MSQPREYDLVEITTQKHDLLALAQSSSVEVPSESVQDAQSEEDEFNNNVLFLAEDQGPPANQQAIRDTAVNMALLENRTMQPTDRREDAEPSGEYKTSNKRRRVAT